LILIYPEILSPQSPPTKEDFIALFLDVKIFFKKLFSIEKTNILIYIKGVNRFGNSKIINLRIVKEAF